MKLEGIYYIKKTIFDR